MCALSSVKYMSEVKFSGSKVNISLALIDLVSNSCPKYLYGVYALLNIMTDVLVALQNLCQIPLL